MIITLISDLGYHDSFVSIVKGILLKHIPDAHVIDISHDVAPYNLLQCSYILKSTYPHFPDGTVHLSLFGMHQDAFNAALVLCLNNQYLISVDNGLLPLSFEQEASSIRSLQLEATNYIEWINAIAKAIADEEMQRVCRDETPCDIKIIAPSQLKPSIKEDSIDCQIIHIDRFENVILNLTITEFEQLRKGRNFRIEFFRNEAITQLSQGYASVARGQVLCWVNSAGYLEIAINGGKAASLLGLQLFDERQVVYKNIKISFV